MKKNYNRIQFLKLAFEQAKINLGSTGTNPSVGCVVEKNGSIISAGYTSLNGRPHAEFNALKKNISFKNANLFVTLEPCSHFGKTPPCTNLIIKKKIKKVFFSTFDSNPLTAYKSLRILKSKKITVNSKMLSNYGKHFYSSYLKGQIKGLPQIDAKIAISNDYYTKNKQSKWITNLQSRRVGHYLRSKYNCIISTSKSINDDNSSLDCRIDGLEKKSPAVFIIDRYLSINTNINLLNSGKKNIFLVTTVSKKKKLVFLKSKGIKIVKIKELNSKKSFLKLFKIIHNMGYSRIFIESGLIFLNQLLSNKLIDNMFIFKSNDNLGKKGINFGSNKIIKNMKLHKNKVNVNLFDNMLYKMKIK